MGEVVSRELREKLNMDAVISQNQINKTATVLSSLYTVQYLCNPNYSNDYIYNYSNDYIYESDIPESFTFRNKILQLYTVQYLCNLKSSSSKFHLHLMSLFKI